jgi:3alpha(or 20beta)-hydroxysteroid dehydrogenase
MPVEYGAGRVSGKVALVTGTASGMGVTHAQLLAREGAKVIMTDVNEADGASIAEQIGSNALFLRHDVADQESWESVVATGVEHFGPISVLVNNAAVPGSRVRTHELPVDEYLRMVQVDQHGTFFGMRAVIPGMLKAGGGSIINISSMAGMTHAQGSPNAAYTTAKFAVRGMTKAAAIEYAADNIRVNSVHPGPVMTAMARDTVGTYGPERLKAYLETIPLGRLAEPMEVSYLVLYLASDESAFSTGSEFVIDGGILAK